MAIVTSVGDWCMRVAVVCRVHRRGGNDSREPGSIALAALAVADVLGASVGKMAIVTIVGDHHIRVAVDG